MNSDNPFGDVNFSTPDPAADTSATPVSADTVNLFLRGLASQPTPFTTLLTAGADTSQGVERVNARTAETGVVGTRDAKGQASFTNVKTNPDTGKQEPVNANSMASTPTPGTGTAQKVATPLALTNIIDQLSKTTDSGAARGLFATFQEAAATEEIRVQTAALQQASAKLGIPGLEKALSDAQLADQQDPKYAPGMGDSHITKGIRTQLELARGYATTEAKTYLANNLSYKLLVNQTEQAKAEMTRVQRLIDRKGLIEDQRTLQSDARTAQKADDLQTKSEQMSTTAIARIQMLQGADFQNEPDPRLKAYQLYVGNKDKNFHLAVDAQGEDLPALAIKGNKYAQELVVQGESANTGQPQEQVKAQLLEIQRTIDSPMFLKNAMDAKYGSDKKKAAAEFGNLTAALKGIDPTKKQEATDQKVRLALEYIKMKKTDVFMNDTNSWGSTDPGILAASQKAFQTTGKKNFEETLSAYVGDATGPTLLNKLSEFKQASVAAALKHKDSVFGMPDYHQANTILARFATESGPFQQWLASVGKQKIGDPTANLIATNPVAAGISSVADNLKSTFNLMTQKNAPGIDPATGLPFGE